MAVAASGYFKKGGEKNSTNNLEVLMLPIHKQPLPMGKWYLNISQHTKSY